MAQLEECLMNKFEEPSSDYQKLVQWHACAHASLVVERQIGGYLELTVAGSVSMRDSNKNKDVGY